MHFPTKFIKRLWNFLKKPQFLFLILLLVCGFLYNYHRIIFYRPVGIHQWRSSVSAAIALNYCHGADFFKSQTNALLADDKTSDISIVEFPVIYYFVSILYRIFGFNEFWFRITQVILGFIGLLCLFKAACYYTKDWFYAAFIPLIVFTSPIYIFYLNNFIPDSVALSVSFIGFYCFTRYTEERRFRMWLLSMGFFLLAGLIKTSALMLYFGIGALAVIELIHGVFRKRDDRLFRLEWKYVVSYLSVLLLIVLWYGYARIYSNLHPRSVSEVEIRPIWVLSGESVEMVIQHMKIWFKNGHYHSRIFLIFSLPVFVVVLLTGRKVNRMLYTLSTLLFLGGFAFTLLFFRSMRNHDYYQINNLIFPVILYLLLFAVIRDTDLKLYRSLFLKLSLLAAMIFMVLNARNYMIRSYDGENPYMVHSSGLIEMFDVEPYLRSLGIERTDRVFCTPDRSVNISLYFCDQKGNTDFDSIGRWPLEKRISYMKTLQTEYVILGSREYYRDVENLDEILGEKIGQTGNTEIFRLIY
ncbi:MAG: glycosyltransferase family 39 protein [Bacteroidales bacterium]|nr:glycosyltransferase family 39 protein [Bacteroidales bacterium]MBN2698113.1 glycosyltransferase family 39 protein [Bacteroidales bacterium]